MVQHGADLTDFIGRILRVPATVVEKEANVMRSKNFNQALVLRAMLVYRGKLVTTGPERCTGRMFEGGDRGLGFTTGID